MSRFKAPIVRYEDFHRINSAAAKSDNACSTARPSAMSSLRNIGQRFRDLHVPGSPFVISNPWDLGTARMLAGIGFEALATTSGGHAFSEGRRDYGITRDEALEHSRRITAAGAARLSLGSMLARHTMAYLFSAAAEMKDSGTFGFASVFAGRDQLDQFMC